MTLNERISSWFEPKPPTPPWKESTARLMLHVLKPDSWKGTQSGHRYWIWDDVSWRALDYDTDEAANARLRTAMLKKMSLSHWADMLSLEKVDVRLDNPKDPAVFQRLQVKAFCKFAKIEYEETQ